MMNDQLERFAVTETTAQTVQIEVFAVCHGFFNDERLLETQSIPLDSLRNQPQKQIDVFLGRGNGSPVEMTLLRAENNVLYLRHPDGQICNTGNYGITFTADYDAYHMLSSRVSLRSR